MILNEKLIMKNEKFSMVKSILDKND